MKMTRLKKRENIAAYLFVGPQIIGFFAFVLFPILFSLYLCFAQWNYIDFPSYVGLKNIISVFKDEIFIKSIKNTLVYLAMVVPLTLITSLLLAVLTNRPLPLKRFYRSAFFLPMVTSTVAIAMVWLFIYQPYGGILNTVLEAFGVKNPPKWLQDSALAKVSVSILSIWLKVGYYYIIFDAGLKNIPHDLYEAAELDGAGSFRKFFSITLPLLSPVTFFSSVMLFIDVFNMFNEVYIMTQGGPDYSTYTLSMYIYFYAFTQADMGRAAVASWVLFILVGIVTFVEFRLKKRLVFE